MEYQKLHLILVDLRGCQQLTELLMFVFNAKLLYNVREPGLIELGDRGRLQMVTMEVDTCLGLSVTCQCVRQQINFEHQ